MRPTSKAALRDIWKSGILSAKRAEALSVLYKHAPGTAGELKRDSGVDGLWKRLGELRDMNLAWEVQERRCTVTGQVVIEWDITDCSNPISFKKSPEVQKPINQLFDWLRLEHGSLPKGDKGRKMLRKVYRKAKELGAIS